jgi:thiol-disulfide isomerase/thioredoxin
MKHPKRSSRRTVLSATAGVAVAGLAGGLLWHQRQDREHRAILGQAPWNLGFPRPEGGELVMASFWGRPLVLNFWATWCPPCIEELPDLDAFHREWSPRGWQVVGLAVDNPRSVGSFLARQPLSFPVGLAGLEGTDLSRQLGNERGALPFTAVFDAQGRVVQRKLGQTDRAELAQWASAM